MFQHYARWQRGLFQRWWMPGSFLIAPVLMMRFVYSMVAIPWTTFGVPMLALGLLLQLLERR
jgi:hypothetical protein